MRASPGRRTSAFPACGAARTSTRSMRLPPRADILARDGTKIAGGEDRSSPLGTAASAIRGDLGKPTPEEAERLRALGVPDDAKVGLNGLERVFQDDLAGRPGGFLRAGTRVLASSTPRAAPAVRTSIDPEIQQATVDALGALYGGVAVDATAHRGDPRPRRRRVLEPAAARLDVQDHHARGRAAAPPRGSGLDLSGADRRDARGRRARERQRRVVRRVAAPVLRALLQLGLRAARGKARRAPARGDLRGVRLQRRTSASPARRRARSRRRTRSATTSRSARRRSVRARCRRPRCRWRGSRARSPTAACASR